MNYTYSTQKSKVIGIQVTNTEMLDFMNLLEFRDKNVSVHRACFIGVIAKGHTCPLQNTILPACHEFNQIQLGGNI